MSSITRKNWPGVPEGELLPTLVAAAGHSCKNAGEMSKTHRAGQIDHPKHCPISSGAIQRLRDFQLKGSHAPPSFQLHTGPSPQGQASAGA